MNISKADIEEFLHLTRRSLVATGKALYSDLLSLPPSKLHHELSSVLVDGERSMVIAYPREFGKSSFAWELLSSWNILHGRYKYIMYIAETIEKAEKNLSINVVETIKAHPLLMMNIEILKDTKSNFFYRNKTTGEKYYVTAHGAGQNLRGMRMQTNRPDFVIIDDIEDTEKVQSSVQREKLKTWFWADVNPLGKEARFFFVGTMLHEDCLLANLMEEPPMDHSLGTPWETRRYGVMDDLGNSVWPEKYSDEWITAKRKEFIRAGRLDRFNTEYLNVPVAKGDRAFTPEQLSFYAPDQFKAARSGGMDILVTVDPGIHNDAHRDPTVILTTGLDKNGNIWMIDLIRERLVHHEILETIVKAYRAATPRMTFIESVQAQYWLFQDLTNGTHPGRDIIPCEKIDGSQVRMGKNIRIQGLEDMFHRKKIFVPADAQWTDELVNEMVTFPKGRHDDILDCFPAGTPVVTEEGVKPIEEVTIKDRVLTRAGFKRVLKAWCKGHREVITRFGITATPDHQIWTENRGWVALDLLTYDDILLVCESHLSSTGTSTTGIQKLSKPSTGDTTSTTIIGGKLPDTFTGIYGRSITARSHKGITSTIETVTTSTTPSKTWNVSPLSNIGLNMLKSVAGLDALQSVLLGWKKLDPSQRLHEESVKIVPVKCAELVSILKRMRRSIAVEVAPTRASKETSGNQKCFETLEPVIPVGRSSSRDETIADTVTSSASTIAQVYDLHVEDQHEFFAFGVLVHNCLSYAKLNHIQIGGCNYNFSDMLAGSSKGSTVF